MSLVVCALSCERIVWVCVDNSVNDTSCERACCTEPVAKLGNVALRKSAGSNVGARNGCKAGSAVWADLDTMICAGAVCCKLLGAGLLFWRRR